MVFGVVPTHLLTYLLTYSLTCSFIIIYSGNIPSRELVPGDIIYVRVGDKIPADCRILQLKTTSFYTDEGKIILTHSLTHSLTHLLTYSLTYSLTYLLTR